MKGCTAGWLATAGAVAVACLLTVPGLAQSPGVVAIRNARIVTFDQRILGLADRLGSIEPGKDADLVLFDGEPFSARARVTAVLVNGEIAYRRSS